MIDEMYTYLSFVIILSVSSSNFFSNASISCETSGILDNCSAILLSRSNSLIAKNLFCSAGISANSLSSTALIVSSTSFANSCTIPALFLPCANATAFSAAFLIPVPFNAEISTTSQPNLFPSLSICIWSPLFSTKSIMLTAMTTGIPSSMICVDRYKLRSIFVPSTILMIASGFSVKR